MLLSKDDILKAEDLDTREVEVPEWGGSVMVRGLSGEERDRFEAMCRKQVPDGKGGTQFVTDFNNQRAKLVALSIVGENGERMFADKEIAGLGKKSAAALQRVFDAALELSGLADDAVSDAEENSAATGGVASS